MDGTTRLVCRETGSHYSFRERSFDFFPIFKDGEIVAYRRGRSPALGFIEQDARLDIRTDIANQRFELRRHRPSVGIWL